MCVVSMIMDHYDDKWRPFKKEWEQQNPPNPYLPFPTQPTQDVSKDIEQLKKEFADMKELLKKAIKYDQDNGEPNCEKPEKLAFIRQMAQVLGLTIDDVFGGPTAEDPLGQRPVGIKVT